MVDSNFLSEENIRKLAQEIEKELQHATKDYSYVWCLLLFIALVGALTAVRKFFFHIIDKITQGTDTNIDDFISAIFQHLTKPETLVVTSAFVATSVYPVSQTITAAVKTAFTIIITLKIIGAVHRSIDFILLEGYADKKDEEGKNLATNFSKILRIFLWGAAILFIMDNIGFNITSVVAGLGIGGITIALATQHILTDTFNSFVIFVDRPFKVGNCITAGGFTGFVQHIGFKTTRIRALSGETVILPNSALTSASVQNFTEAEFINGAITVAVDNETDHEILQKLPKILLETVGTVNNIKPVQAYLKELGQYSTNFEVRFCFQSPNAVEFREALGQINTAVIHKVRDDLKVVMPYPTTRVRLHPEHVRNPIAFNVGH